MWWQRNLQGLGYCAKRTEKDNDHEQPLFFSHRIDTDCFQSLLLVPEGKMIDTHPEAAPSTHASAMQSFYPGTTVVVPVQICFACFGPE